MVKALRYVQVEPILPDGLKPPETAQSLWCWNRSDSSFRRIDSKLWEETGHNPIKVLAQISQDKLEKLEKDLSFRAHLESLSRSGVYQHNSNWFNEQHFQTEQPEFAYFSAEFGITECLPIYSGGLGVLAGDHLKSASDLGLPLVGIGLLYQRGYFQQYLNADGWQQEYYPEFDFSSLPVTEANDLNVNHSWLVSIFRVVRSGSRFGSFKSGEHLSICSIPMSLRTPVKIATSPPTCTAVTTTPESGRKWCSV
jgi:starch phosphorylase